VRLLIAVIAVWLVVSILVAPLVGRALRDRA